MDDESIYEPSSVESMLTTEDNPFDPFENFDEWYEFDVSKGYNTCAYVARVALTSESLSYKDNQEAIDDAIDEILNMNLTGNYKIVYKTKK